MPQTLFAILSIIVVSTVSLSVHTVHVKAQHATLRREVEEMAGAVAVEVMEVIRTRAFDKAVTDRLTAGDATDLNKFTFIGSVDHFETGKQCSVFHDGIGVDCSDVDDFHKMKTADYDFKVGHGKVHFDVDVTVEYSDGGGVRQNTRTFNKQITVKVQDNWDGNAAPFLVNPIQLQRIMTYKFPNAGG